MSRLELFNQIGLQLKFTKLKLLDAGSGSTSLDFLSMQDFNELWAVSIDSVEIKRLKYQISKLNVNKTINVLRVDLSRETEFNQNYFDVIWADYFFAAIEGHTPFRIGYAMKELKRIIKKEGKLIIIGWNMPFDQSRLENSKQELILKMINLKYCTNQLLGRIPYRELPDYWIIDLAELNGFNLLQQFYVPSMIKLSFFESYYQSILKKTSKIFNRNLGIAIEKEASRLLNNALNIKEFTEGVAFGNDYGLIFSFDK